ncbi:hypothetical protein N7532_009286 [Penicillium argentinense]|uniref:Protein kinase domain-containing protein n=1 Tax=Penicillium argentinense TaxID=1131581 RepID=A0A9W9K3B5_9EURO|nr:uncharacterized protein N7532_009286 [Penicillium argentinense]KAJ5090602.1 hypothetical protein N7532_009286 [Penicillium argentinense]
MASTPYTTMCTEVYAEFMDEFQLREDGQRRFAIRGTAKEVLHREKLLRFFRCLNLPRDAHLGPSDTTQEMQLARKFEKKSLHEFLAILLFSCCDIEAAQKFIRKVLLTESWSVEACSLPANENTLRELFEDRTAADQFLSQQAIFCPVVIERGKEIAVPSLDRRRLPYVETEFLGRGAFGTVYRVKVARGHFRDSDYSSDKPTELARKDYELVGGDSRPGTAGFAGDHEIMKTIISLDKKCDNIVESLGSLVIDSSTYSLFMPLALCDLKQYMTNHRRKKPKTKAEKMAFIQSARGLANGLEFLHDGMMTKDGYNLVCYHMDLKPDNVLIFPEITADGEKHIWKISDFGMSHVKYRRRGEKDKKKESVKDFNRWFARHPQMEPQARPQDNSVSGVVNQRGDGTYLAPESMTNFPILNTSSDVWSLGCIISVVFAYLEEGANGVAEYANNRLTHTKAGGVDRFFLRKNGGSRPKVNHPVVKRWHSYLIEKAMYRSKTEGRAVELILRFLEDSVFQEQPKRCDARELERKLLRAWEMYKEVPNLLQTDGRQSSFDNFLRGTGIRRTTSIEEHAESELIETLRIRESEPFKGSEISPDGSAVAFWTNSRIFLYKIQFPSLTGMSMMRAASWELSNDKRNFILKSVGLTERYLVASVSGSFQFFLFDLERTPPPDGELGNPIPVDHKHLPEISKLAISPDSETIIFLLRNHNVRSESALLYRAPTEDTRNHQSIRAMHRINCSATQITNMAFSTNDDLYYVVLPDPLVYNHGHEVSIFHVSLREGCLNQLKIQTGEPGNHGTVGLFTTFVPYPREPDRCVVDTREKRIRDQTMSQKKSTDSQYDIKNYRILKIMMSHGHNRIIAVGRPVASHKMLLLELVDVPHKAPREYKVMEIVFLQGISSEDDFKERLCGNPGEEFVLLATLTAENQRAVYKIRLPPIGSSLRT